MTRYNSLSLEKKEEYKILYLSGLTLKEITQKAGVGVRTIYHRLQPLTALEKSQHIYNLEVIKEQKKQDRR